MRLLRMSFRGAVVLSIILILFSAGAGQAQPIAGQRRPYTIGITRNDASLAPLILAEKALTRAGTPIRIIFVRPESGATALRVKEIDLLYTDGVVALMGSLKVQRDIAFIAAGLPVLTGSMLAARTVTGFSDPRLAKRAIGGIVSNEPQGQGELSFEALALRAILRTHGLGRVFVVPMEKEKDPEKAVLGSLNSGFMDLAYVAPERVPVALGSGAKQLSFKNLPFQGVIVAARWDEARSNRKEILTFLRAFIDGIREFRETNAGVSSLRSAGLDENAANYVYKIYMDRKAFSDFPAPDPNSLSSIIRELALFFSEAKEFNVQAQILCRPLESVTNKRCS